MNWVQAYPLEHMLVFPLEGLPVQGLVLSLRGDRLPCKSGVVLEGAAEVIEHKLDETLTLRAFADPPRGQHQCSAFVYHPSRCETYLTKSECQR